MAATLTQSRIKGFGEDALLYVWDFDGTSQTGESVSSPSFSDRSVHVAGAGFGGSTVTVEGSNNGTDWVTLTDTAGTALTFTSAGLKQILQVTRFIRAKVTGGAATAINVSLLTVKKGV